MDRSPPTVSLRSWGITIEDAPLTPPSLSFDELLTAQMPRQVNFQSRYCHPLSTSNSNLQIVVMGASVTTGCGALPKSARCVIPDSWTHHFAGRLRDRLTNMPKALVRSVSVEVWGKNAVTSEYFMMCPSRFGLSANTSVVLLEAEPAHGFAQYLGPKVHGPPESFVSSKVAAYKSWARLVRRFAPNAWLGYVGWPGWGRALSLDGLAAEAAFFSQVEEHLAAATFALPVLIAASQRNQTRWYADGMHPNQDGHALLGELAASLVMSSWPSRPGRSCAGTKGSALGNNVIPSSEHSHDVCALDACDMPVTLSRDFDLRDEGGTKGVKKFGYVSTVPGGFLTLGPLVPELNCALFEASVGYLSSWHPNMGAFDVSCSGCECKPLAGAWANALKFPRVTTWTSSDPKDATNSLNASLTLFNKFLLYKTPAPCFINVTHAHRDYQRAGPSRIRIDSLSLQLAGCSVSCELTKRPWTKDFGVRTRSTCWSGANRGLASYLVPSCFNHSIRCTDPKVTGHPEYT